jgi:hypothetical protein
MLFRQRKQNHCAKKGTIEKGLRSVVRKEKLKRPKNWHRNRLEQRN